MNGEPEPQEEEASKTRRYYIRVLEATADEIDGYIAASGLLKSHFLATSLVFGARMVGRSLNPEQQVELMAKVMLDRAMADPEYARLLGLSAQPG